MLSPAQMATTLLNTVSHSTSFARDDEFGGLAHAIVDTVPEEALFQDWLSGRLDKANYLYMPQGKLRAFDYYEWWRLADRVFSNRLSTRDVGVANAKAESWIREVKKESPDISNQELAKRSAKVFADIKTAAFKHWDSMAGVDKRKFDSYVR